MALPKPLFWSLALWEALSPEASVRDLPVLPPTQPSEFWGDHWLL